jgi:hypothetical protein
MNYKRKARLNASKYYSVTFTKLSRKKKKKLKLIYFNHALSMMKANLWDSIIAYYPFYPLVGGQEIPKKVFNFREITVHGINKYNT